MFVILGLSGSKPQITKSTHFLHCPNCYNQRFWNLIHERTNFSLFFLPVFPVKDKYYLACPLCNNGETLTKEEYKKKIDEAYAYETQFSA